MATYTPSRMLVADDNGVIQGRPAFNYGFPKGTILMWNSNTIPSGWVECNGQNGTPEIRGRFPIGVGSGYNLGSTGGLEKVALNSSELPSHAHTGKTDDVNYGRDNYNAVNLIAVNRIPDDDGTHTHTFTTDETGGGAAHNNMPPYYVLRFIMKT